MNRFEKERSNKNFIRCNEKIRVREVRVVKDGENFGVMSTYDALSLSRKHELDLVEISPESKPPVCQIMDYGKFMFDKSKKDRTKGKADKEKEISFRYVIDSHDLITKANQARKFLLKGMKVKFIVKFKAREKAHKDQGLIAINKIINLLSDIATPERQPSFEGNNITARLDLKKDATA